MKILLSVVITATIIVLVFFALQPDTTVNPYTTVQPSTTMQSNTVQPDTTSTTQSSKTVEWNCNGHVAFGVPGEVDQLLCRDGYAVGYDYDRKVPSWVAYHITKDSVDKKYKRSNKFKVDEDIPEVYRSTLSDYKGSGYDRGHMAPAATIDFTEASMQESFLLSNMTPQMPGLNRQGWRHLEEYVRDWTNERSDLYVVTGSLFEGEVVTIGDNVGVPSSFYKVIYDPAQSDGIAFIVPHRDINKAELPSFIVSIDQVEEKARLDFMSSLSDDIEADIEDDIESMW